MYLAIYDFSDYGVIVHKFITFHYNPYNGRLFASVDNEEIIEFANQNTKSTEEFIFFSGNMYREAVNFCAWVHQAKEEEVAAEAVLWVFHSLFDLQCVNSAVEMLQEFYSRDENGRIIANEGAIRREVGLHMYPLEVQAAYWPAITTIMNGKIQFLLNVAKAAFLPVEESGQVLRWAAEKLI